MFPASPHPIETQPSALPAAVDWVSGVLTGTAGTVVATLAIAAVGLAMLQGRMAVRDAARVVLGCFVLFGAPVIARGLLGIASPATSVSAEIYYSAPSASPVTGQTPQADQLRSGVNTGASVPW